MKVLRRSLHRDSSSNSNNHSPTSASTNRSSRSSSTNHQHFILSNTNTAQQQHSMVINSLSMNPASTPPLMVIRAISNYKANRIVELSFSKGDFFHVTGERIDSTGEYFEASNPANGSRGIVPKHLFQALRRQQPSSPSNLRQLNSTINQSNQPITKHHHFKNVSSSSSSASSASSSASSPPSPNSPSINPNLHHSRNRPPSAGLKAQPLYGIVQHDFVAERPDELDAKRGESIIIIAQSNHEWFVAKPIGRLGGPGLIPVSFVEVQDLSTGKALTPNQVKDLIKSAIVPKVEEWKKATAAYKGNSIPLGRFDFGSKHNSVSSQNQPLSAASFSNPPTASSHMSSRSVSVTNPRQASPNNSLAHLNGSQTPKNNHPGSWHGTGVADQYNPTAPQTIRASSSSNIWNQGSGVVPTSAAQPSTALTSSSQREQVEQSYDDGLEGDGYATVDELRERYGVVSHASVESFHYEQGHFWFHLRAHFTRSVVMEEGETPRIETTVLVLYRLHEDFYDFHAALIEHFQNTEDGVPVRIDLPNIPTPTENVDALVCSQRIEQLSFYLYELCRLDQTIRECELVYEFLGPREGDVELEGDPASLGFENPNDRSLVEVEGEVVEYLQKMESSNNSNLLNQSITRLSTGSSPPNRSLSSTNSYQSHHRQGSRVNSSSSATGSSPPFLMSATSSDGTSINFPSGHTSASSLTFPRSSGSSSGNGGGGGLGLQNLPTGIPSTNNTVGGFMRIKIYQRQTDDLIAIRAPVGVRFPELIQRIKDRVGPEVRSIRFRDETGKGYSTGGSLPEPAVNGGRLVGIDNEADLERWIGGGGKLVLYVE
ncbi:hypothetical protein BY996DRAFT_4586572 [Phakopsora pachyrhizi]|uniref:Bud emergence protein 1 n=1 Tax=Phakopsora pachyrhizi TaxID=170000 RepID=A0AAV0AQC1_PHAPC|nr:hypothetical protein BY996DRAFT_4586572 [Phakopsora pachyrhizi]CAH7671328.1 hypothetical protein PPACK8108_LOCUS6099 [Phakopsora pachyrhizi]